MIDFAKLAEPFPAKAISWRVGSTMADKSRGMALAYIDSRDVADRLDEVCGPAGWQCRYSHVGAITVCEIGILVGEQWLYKADGAGQSDIEAEKGALSDAFKRAAVRWQIGRYLYNLASPWVELETRGRTSVIKASEYAKLEKVLNDYAAGIKTPPSLPPADPDVTDAATRWVHDNTGFLSTLVNSEDVLSWHKKYSAHLKKLQGQSETLYERVMGAYGHALDRTRREAA